MLNQIFSALSSKISSLHRAIKKLPWSLFAMVLLIHLSVLWWILGGYFSRTSDILPEPLFVTLESFEASPAELSNQSAKEEPAKDDLVVNRSDRAEGLR